MLQDIACKFAYKRVGCLQDGNVFIYVCYYTYIYIIAIYIAIDSLLKSLNSTYESNQISIQMDKLQMIIMICFSGMF